MVIRFSKFLKEILKGILLAAFKAAAEGVGNADYKSATSIYDFTVTDIDGNQVSLEKYR